MGKNTEKHGYMKKECLILQLDIKKYMYGHMTLMPIYYDAKQEIIELQCTPK